MTTNPLRADELRERFNEAYDKALVEHTLSEDPDAMLQDFLWRELSALLTPPPSEPDSRQIVEALGFDPTNHHNAAQCPYCTHNGKYKMVEAPPPSLASVVAEPQSDVYKLIEGFADNIQELALRMPAPNEFTPQFVAYANAMRFIARKRREKALTSGTGWRGDMENAPRKGRDLFLLLGPSGIPQVARANTWWTAGFSVENNPTHWMPLPDAPQPKTGDA